MLFETLEDEGFSVNIIVVRGFGFLEDQSLAGLIFMSSSSNLATLYLLKPTWCCLIILAFKRCESPSFI